MWKRYKLLGSNKNKIYRLSLLSLKHCETALYFHHFKKRKAKSQKQRLGCLSNLYYPKVAAFEKAVSSFLPFSSLLAF
jgi:hypothetical protein